jgi:hypothetical protein
MPSGQPIAANRIIATTLTVGTCAVFKGNGGTIKSTEADREIRPSRRKSSSSASAESPVSSSVNADEIPLTQNFDHLFEWTFCKPGNRQQNMLTAISENRFAVDIVGEPVTFIFTKDLTEFHKRDAELEGRRSSIVSKIIPSRPQVNPAVAGTMLYLVEVQYHIRLETGLVSTYILVLS